MMQDHHQQAGGEKRLADIIAQNEAILLAAWIDRQMKNGAHRNLREADLREQAREFLHLLRIALQNGDATDIQRPEWDRVLELLADLSRTRSELGFSLSETASFVFSFKFPLFEQLRAQAADTETLGRDILLATELLDRLGLYTTEMHLKKREDIIIRQQQEMLELSTPVVSLAEGILALPVIGTLDSSRTQVVMESLLQRIVDTGSTVAIIDITGVPTVDTLVAQHLLKTVTAARLMGADCIISGIRPQIAQTIVHLGVELGDVTTKATLASAFKAALERVGMALVKKAPLRPAESR
jgi:rsbT co-antagonist protein RsbR